MKKIVQDIKDNKFEQFYLLYGEEDYLKNQYRDMLVKAMVPDVDDNMNYSVYEGKKLDVKAMLDIGDTLPFFAENRVIVIENSGFLKKTPDGLDKRMENFPESTHVIFVETEKDGRSKLFTWFKKHGYAVEMKTPSEGDLKKWVAKQCKDEGKQIYENAAEYFFGAVGLNMMLIKNELEKVFSYVGDREEITVEDIHAICVNEADDTMYAMLDAIGERDQPRALKLYRNLLELKVDAYKILSGIMYHMKSMMEISDLILAGKSYDEIASAAHVPKWTINKYKTQIRSNDGRSFTRMFERCVQTDEDIKTGKIKDTVGVELLIVEFSSR